MTVKLIGYENLSVASAAVHFLSDLGRLSSNMARTLLSKKQESNLNLLKSVMRKRDEVRYRIFEVPLHRCTMIYFCLNFIRVLISQ